MEEEKISMQGMSLMLIEWTRSHQEMIKIIHRTKRRRPWTAWCIWKTLSHRKHAVTVSKSVCCAFLAEEKTKKNA